MLAFVSTSEWTIRVAALFPLAFLAARYVRGYRRGSFSPIWDVPEALALFVILAAVGPEHGLGLLYVGLYFRFLYGSLGPALVRALLYFGAFAGAMALAAASPAAILSARIVPHAIGFVAVACVMNFLATILGKHERAMSREKILGKAGAALSAAVGREDTYEATLGAALELIGETPGARVGLAVGSEEGMTVVASAGYRAEEIRGDRFKVHALPEPLRTRLLE